MSTISYSEINPAGFSHLANGLIGLPFSSTHTISSFLVTGLKMCVTVPSESVTVSTYLEVSSSGDNISY